MHPFKQLTCVVPPFVVHPRRLAGLADNLYGVINRVPRWGREEWVVRGRVRPKLSKSFRLRLSGLRTYNGLHILLRAYDRKG